MYLLLWKYQNIENPDRVITIIGKNNPKNEIIHRKFGFIKGDKTYLEREPLQKIGKKGELYAYKHDGFWQCMDTVRDKEILEENLKRKKL